MEDADQGAPGYQEIVRTHRMDTVAYVLADSGECLDIQREEVANVPGRRIVPLTSTDLAELEPPGSWFLAALLCPGDTTETVAAWATGYPADDLDRIRFYDHPDTDPATAYAAWNDAGLGAPLRDTVADFPSFHRRFGNHLNDRIFLDWRGGPKEG